ncbi:ZYBA0S08-01684g1_1 [Zygosaccharomyces bailii CLIB 213]|uniref:Structure-specific endonuclease subunit SLX4 n=1 Tax=Zygosaccharomyces bailii (strain CLIB 213 / ATCC 58445 / CBS 680 / BCRC 21525 / NBRC 1098 / NCYC 1416 / NRRL Y-2227) TaxID=1333698 RepID=A0A8J2XCG5_ZYGB2|nr:ZYBA0S08-01684g1_1 [Zygosaccharomyces bailii CLIB 213]
MDFQRANRNLQLVTADLDDVQDVGSPDDVNGGDTQIPGSQGFLDDSDQDDQDRIFINTQVQGRLDEADQADKVRASLTQFKYVGEGLHHSPENMKIATKRTSCKPLKRTSVRQRIKKTPSKAQNLLKQLSGKHAKVKDMIRYQKKLDSLAEAQQKAAPVKGKRTKSVKKGECRFDTYNEEEWQRISKLLLERFPHLEPAEVKGVYEYLYGETEEYTLWTASQLPVNSEKLGARLSPGSDSPRISVLSLSQAMDDSYPVNETAPEAEEEDDASIVPDSTEELSTIIPIEPVVDAPQDFSQIQLDTPLILPPNEIIDLTQESFKVVKSLTSPLKQENTPQVEVPATRLPTISGSAELGPVPLLAPAKEEPVRYKVHRSQLEELSAVEGLIVHSSKESLDDALIADTESDVSSPHEHCLIELETSILANRTPSPSHQNIFESQSAQQLRQSMRSMGLKTSRSKQEMLQSLQAASQVLRNTSTDREQKRDIYNFLTSLIQSSPTLLEKVYTFQPIASRELLTKLVGDNPFVEKIDEFTIREWADYQGICLTNS